MTPQTPDILPMPAADAYGELGTLRRRCDILEEGVSNLMLKAVANDNRPIRRELEKLQSTVRLLSRNLDARVRLLEDQRLDHQETLDFLDDKLPVGSTKRGKTYPMPRSWTKTQVEDALLELKDAVRADDHLAAFRCMDAFEVAIRSGHVALPDS